ncbi:hypothetical protein BJV82DRAFT_610757 [Fennellomyces sp. T-0311]|nr:hypothetical protein BJV82DRAFT_610757 [Fennellomyces sp. T-0311]
MTYHTIIVLPMHQRIIIATLTSRNKNKNDTYFGHLLFSRKKQIDSGKITHNRMYVYISSVLYRVHS